MRHCKKSFSSNLCEIKLLKLKKLILLILQRFHMDLILKLPDNSHILLDSDNALLF